jgi:hypothetical protein
MEVSYNGGTPKSSKLDPFSIETYACGDLPFSEPPLFFVTNYFLEFTTDNPKAKNKGFHAPQRYPKITPKISRVFQKTPTITFKKGQLPEEHKFSAL